MLMPMNRWCVSCGHNFHSGTTTPPPTETQCGSSLFGSNPEQVLCIFCSQAEENAIDKEGTNNIPQLLQSYRKSYEQPPF